jgi:hypothetical protein
MNTPNMHTQVDLVPIVRVTPYGRNAKKHPPEQIAALARQIREHGWDQPIVVDGDGIIIKGHGRRLAALELGLEMVPVIVRDDLTPAQKKAARLADNKLAESGWDLDMVLAELEELKGLDEDIDLALSGFSDKEFDKLAHGQRFADVQNGKLSEKFVVPPFSTLDTRAGYWTERKAAWRELLGDEGASRKGTLGESGLMQSVNDGVSLFDPVLAEVICRWFALPGSQIVDPFSGGMFGLVAKTTGHHFTGIEIREEQATLNQARTDAIVDAPGSALYINDNSLNIDEHVEDGTKDLLFSCPPYYDLEVYSDKPGDLSNLGTYEEFRDMIRTIFHKAIRKLKENRFAVIVIGEIRDERGVYRGFVPDTIRIMVEGGMHFHHELILINSVGNAQLRAARQMATRRAVKLHQNVLVFYKGDPRKISSVYPRIEGLEDALGAGAEAETEAGLAD